MPETPTFPFGNFKGLNVNRRLDLILAHLYNMTTERFFGCYLGSRPLLIIRDLELVKNILVKDFSYFHNRGLDIDIEHEPIVGKTIGFFASFSFEYSDIYNRLFIHGLMIKPIIF